MKPKKETKYYDDGSIFSEHYYLNGESHREDGPASIYYHRDGSIKEEYYFLNDKELTKQEHYKQTKEKYFKLMDEVLEEMLDND